MLYYGLDAPTYLTDGEFDKATLILAERWDELEPIRKWQLGSPKDIRSTGNHVKVTALAAFSGLRYLEEHHGETRRIVTTRAWRKPRARSGGQCDFLLPAEFTWHN